LTRIRSLATLFLCAVLFSSKGLSAQKPLGPEPYLDPALPFTQRVEDLVQRMTLDEKVSQMQNAAPAIPRLHIAEYDWWNEGLHGVARSGYATVFPQAIGLAATWDVDLMQRVADTISTEARAKYNEALRTHNHSIYYGLTFWSPNINIDRDPRWGRGQETYGEDPFLTGQIGAAFVRGLQGSDPNTFKVIATAKHFAVHSGPESERHSFDAVISAHDLEDTYLPAFRKLVVDAHVDSVMCAYNSIDGAPACANTMLLQQKLKQDWHFNGYIVSDCAAITDVAVGHKFAPDMPHAAAQSVLAGTDLSCGKEYAALTIAVKQGLIKESAIDDAVKRLFLARFQLGMFNPAVSDPYASIPFSSNDSAANKALALQTARDSMVLLKNNGILPLAKSIRSIAVVGPNAMALAGLEGNYNAIASHPVAPLTALQQRFPGQVHYAQGAPYVEGAPVPVPPSVFTTRTDGTGEPGLTAEYFRDTNFNAAPVARRIDPNIDFDWNGASPLPGASAEAFSIRWSGSITSPVAGTLPFSFLLAHCSTCDDAESISVWFDGHQVYDFHHAPTHGRHAPTPDLSLTFPDTKAHALRIEYTHKSPLFGAGLTFNWTPPTAALIRQAVDAAKQSDVAIAFLGLSPNLEGEEMPIHLQGFDGGDRTSIDLPDTQQQLVTALAATGKPLIIVLMNGSALALHDANDKAAAILEAWYPGQDGGTAIAETLSGENNPSGRLPVTFYAGTDQLAPFGDYSMKNRTYRYFTGKPLYSFGYGLSYTRFQYASGKLSTTNLQAGLPLNVSLQLKNIGNTPGKETVELYLIPLDQQAAPLRSLVGFKKVTLTAGEQTTVQVTIDPRQLSLVDEHGQRSVQPGKYELYIGGGQPIANQGISLPFEIAGPAADLPR
jgi:beta-glucosidase